MPIRGMSVPREGEPPRLAAGGESEVSRSRDVRRVCNRGAHGRFSAHGRCALYGSGLNQPIASVLAALLCLAVGWAAAPPVLASDEACTACQLAQVSPRLQTPQLETPRLQARFTRVPDVRGLSRAEAERILRAANLVLAEGGRRPGQDRADIVLEQTPAPNTTVTQGSRVTVILSAEPAGVPTPDVQGRSRTQAEAILKRLGLQMAVGGQRESSDAADIVLDQNPEPGTRLARGATVTVILSVPRAEPSPLVVVPDVQGRPRAEAERILQGSRLQMTVGGQQESERPADTVLDQRPEPGTRLRPGATVTVILSTPRPEPSRLVQVPDVRGRPTAEAERILKGADLPMAVSDRQPSEERPDLVLDQKPGPGTQVRRGTTVTVIVSAPFSTVAVPDVRRRRVADATQAVQDAGLTLRVARQQESEGPADIVLDQEPVPGTQVRRATTVAVVVSVPLPTVTVPDVRGRSSAEAERMLRGADLAMIEGERRPSGDRPDTVLEQRPGPGTQVRRGTTVTVILSAPSPTVTVPNVTGMDRTQAERAVRAADLTLAEGGRRPSGDPPETVLAQDPRAGAQATRGSAVTVILSVRREEPPPVAVPQVLGRSAAEAESILRGTDLAMVVGERRPSQERPDTVLEQSPAPGTQVRRGTSVTVIVSAPSPTVSVPDVRGRSRAEAARVLRGAELAYVEGDRRPSTGRPDIVLDQEPRPGAQATRGSAVTVILSTAAPVPPPVAVPDLRGQSQAEATQRLQAVGLVLSVGGRQESREPADVVLQQEPSPGAQVSRGTTVTVTLSAPVSTITVPDVVGRPRPEAEQLLREKALRMVEGERRPSPGPADVVLEQDPRPDTQVTQGSAVTVTLSAPAGFRVQWPVAAAAGAAALAGVGAVRWLRSRKVARGKVPQVRISVTPDLGVQALGVTAEDVRLPTLRLRGQPDPGRQEIIMHEQPSPEEGQP